MHLGGREAADGAEHLGLLVAHRVGLEGDRRLHRREAHELEQVVLEHVAHHAGFLVVARPVLDSDRLRGGDLHVMDVVAIPHRLEDGVREPEDHQVLHRLLAEVVVDAVDLMLRERLPDRAVERLRRSRGRARTASRSPPAPTAGPTGG